MAPVQRRAQRPLAGGGVAHARPERHVQARGDLGRREQPAAGRRQLDRERQPVKLPADRRDRARVLLLEPETRVVRSGALAEQRDGGDARQCPEIGLATRLR